MTTRARRVFKKTLCTFLSFLMAIYLISLSVFVNDGFVIDKQETDSITSKKLNSSTYLYL
jgi:hypothetical protein